MRLQTQVAPEIQKRLLLSRVEAESLKERDILCPTCGFRIQRVFSDATGHLSVKCQKSVPEQKRIGLFFENLDNLITLHQRKPNFYTGGYYAE